MSDARVMTEPEIRNRNLRDVRDYEQRMEIERLRKQVDTLLGIVERLSTTPRVIKGSEWDD